MSALRKSTRSGKRIVRRAEAADRARLQHRYHSEPHGNRRRLHGMPQAGEAARQFVIARVRGGMMKDRKLLKKKKSIRKISLRAVRLGFADVAQHLIAQRFGPRELLFIPQSLPEADLHRAAR